MARISMRNVQKSSVSEYFDLYLSSAAARGVKDKTLQTYNKDIIKYFYEVVVSENLLDELHKYISEDCVQRVGEKVYFVGTAGMK